MTPIQEQKYKEITNKSQFHINVEKTRILLQLITRKDYKKAYEQIPVVLEELEKNITDLQAFKLAVLEAKAEGIPLREIHMNKAVACSYLQPETGLTCSTCKHACKIVEEQDEVVIELIVCNINDQAYDAHKEGYTNQQIYDTFGVHPEGRCKFQQSLGEDESPVDFDDYVEGKETGIEESPEVPPEASGGFVDREHMEHGESSIP